MYCAIVSNALPLSLQKIQGSVLVVAYQSLQPEIKDSLLNPFLKNIPEKD